VKGPGGPLGPSGPMSPSSPWGCDIDTIVMINNRNAWLNGMRIPSHR